MCGICGWLLPPGARRPAAELEAMARSISHRGPDDHGIFRDEEAGIALAHNRLSIIDLTPAGHQPMLSEGGGVVLVYNGEIYNFAELREELKAFGHRFISRSDTEVLLKAYLQWGAACVNRLCGMFAFALWDGAKRRLLLARDPMGMKPLYYRLLEGGGIVFASEIKAFLSLAGFAGQARPESVLQFLEFGYVFEEHATMMEGVLKLPPGHTLEAGEGSVGKPLRYFDPPAHRGSWGEEPTAADLEATLETVVAQHLVADVPVGILLSGGLDSSLVAALASRVQRVTTVSMAFADSAVDERPFARAVSRHIGSEHHEIVIRPEQVTAGIGEVVWYFDDLFADWGTFSTRILYQRCRELGIKVVLVGEGSDELFGGYPVFDHAAALRGPMPLRFFSLYRRYAGRRYGKLFGEFAAVMRGHLAAAGDLFGAVRLFESRNQLPNNYVMKVDKASMSVSVEARAPFLDRRVAELAYRIPKERLLGEGGGKALLRAVARTRGLLPDEISNRPKYGASIAASWIDDSPAFREYAREVILNRGGLVDDLGLRKAMEAYFLRGKKGYPFPSPISIFSNLAWRLLLLTLWSARYAGR